MPKTKPSYDDVLKQINRYEEMLELLEDYHERTAKHCYLEQAERIRLKLDDLEELLDELA